MRISVVQMNSQNDKPANLARAEELVRSAAAEERPDLVILPEYFAHLSDDPAEMHASGEEIPGGETCRRFSRLAAELEITLHCGSIVERSNGEFFNTSIVFGPDGSEIARYRKIHLFDIDITENVTANESATIKPGNEVVTADIDGHRAGLSICYDLRFPEIYRQMALAGAKMLFVPAAFTMFTGKDHWHVLLRARAIENQAFVIAPGQVGKHEPGGAQCYGHSVIIDPWGTVLADAPDTEGVIVANLDFTYVEKVRRQLPSLANRRPSAYREPSPVGD